jgi:ribosomal protein L37AE/L43A
MSRFKRCEIQDCTGQVSRAHPIIVRLHSIDEGFGHFHNNDNNPVTKKHGEKCPHCGEKYIVRIKDIKMKICNDCYFEFKEGNAKLLNIQGLDRRIESVDDKKKVLFYTLATDPSMEGE